MSEELEYKHDADGKSKEELEKEAAKKKAEEKTGADIEKLNDVARNILKAHDSLERGNPEKSQEDLEKVVPVDQELLDKMRDNEVTDNIVKAGLGAEHLAAGAGKLKESVGKVQDIGRQYSAGSKMGDVLEKSSHTGQNSGSENGNDRQSGEQTENNLGSDSQKPKPNDFFSQRSQWNNGQGR